MPKVLLRAVLVWLVIIAVETVHGVLRTILLVPLVGDFPARRVSVFTGSLLIFGVAWVFVRWIGANTRLRLLSVGMLWVVLTVLFEIALGRFALGLSWDRIAEDYDVTRGGLLSFGLLFMAAAPTLAAKLRGCSGAKTAPNLAVAGGVVSPTSASAGAEPVLRPVVPTDTPAIVALACSSGVSKPDEADAIRGMLDEYHATNTTGGQMHVWAVDGTLAGVVYFAPRPFADRVWELLMIAVDAPRHRQGIGSKMLSEVEAAVRAADGRLLLIETSSTSSFERTRQFYRKHGYDEVAHIPDYFTDGDGKASFVKRLAPPRTG
jgi:ribosomal protein S18 acetylase RimI-like enzyme